MQAKLIEMPIVPREILRSVASSKAGAIVTFDGVVRDHARGKQVTHLFYEAYPGMALKELEKLRQETLERFSVLQVVVVHRIGRLEIGESSVFIAVSSSHRADAFEACRYLIDRLKTTIPIWKKECYEDGEVWIEEYGT